MLADGSQAHDPTQFDSNDPIFNQPQQQQRQPGQVEGMMRAMQQWGQGPSGVSQRFANPGLYDIQRASYELQQSVDSDTAEKLQKYTNKMIDEVQGSDTPGLPPGLPSLKRARGGSICEYDEPPHNNANNDQHQGHSSGRDAISYKWGKVSPRFQSQGAEITPHGHNEVTPRKRAHGGSCSCCRCGGRFAKGGAAVTPTWKDRPPAVAQRTTQGLKIHAPHSGEGLVMNIHLSPVGEHAISFHSGPDGYSGGVDSMQMPYDAGPQQPIQAVRPAVPQGMSAWNLEGANTLARMR
jgi:hypothetical protein